MMSSKRTGAPHPWHEGQPFCLPQSADKMENRRVGTAGHTKQSGGQRTSGPRPRRRSSRLWQLPEESIAGYAQWIQDKPEEDQTSGERRFLWKYMMRYFSVRQSHDSTRSFVEQLELKPATNRTALENAFIKQYHRRRKERKNERKRVLPASVVSDEADISWARPSAQDRKPKKSVSFFPSASTGPHTASATTGPSINLSGLQESMEKLRLSLNNLKDKDMKDDASIEMSI